MFDKDYRLKKMLIPNRLWKKSIKEENQKTMMKIQDHPKKSYKKVTSKDQVSLMDSNFSNLTYISELQWDDELERVYQHGEDLVEHWYLLLNRLNLSLDKLTSPFQNTNRASLHQTQKFIEYILNDRKTYGHEKIYLEKLQSSIEKYSESTELRDCAQQIYELEKDLYDYRHTLDLQLTFLWNTKQKDQSIALWKKYIHHYHVSIKQMETKFITLLEKSTPNPDEYTCSICFSVFTNPVTIHPCLHTFCRGCLQKLYCQCTIKECKSSCHDTDPSSRLSTMNPDHHDDEYIQVPTHYTNAYHHHHHRSRRPSATSSLLLSSLSENNNHNNRTISTINVNNMNHLQQRRRSSFQRLSFMPPFKPNPHGGSSSTDSLLKCTCPSPWQLPSQCRCPRCQYTFGPEDCTFATGLDNLIRLYFPRQDHLYHQYQVRQKQLKRKSILNSLSSTLKLMPSASTPSPRQRLFHLQQKSISPSHPLALSSISTLKDSSFSRS